MTRKWGESGVGGDIDYQLDQRVKQHLEDTIRSKGIKKIPEEFFDDIAKAIKLYLSNRKVYDKSKPSIIRENLQSALNKVLDLQKKLNCLDENSRILLSETIDGGLTTVQNHLNTITTAISEARHIAYDYPKKGPLPDNARLWLANNVAEAIETRLGVSATSTKNGLFESVLSVILESILGKSVSSTHDLCRRALKVKKICTSQGLIEYRQPEDE